MDKNIWTVDFLKESGKHLNGKRNKFIKDNFPQNSIGVEIGVNRGRNSQRLYNELSPKKLYLVDAWDISYYEINVELMTEEQINIMTNNINIVKLYVNDMWKDSDNVVIKDLDSHSASKSFDDNYFDFIYIDAGHAYDSVYNDLTYWYPKLKTDGVLGGHDYNHVDVKKAVSDFLTNNKILMTVKHNPNLQVGADGCSDWILINN
jgi:hypothetical protein